MENAELKSLLEKHHQESYGWALSCCSRISNDAEVVLQSVYLKLLQGKARFDGDSSFRTWLFSVIRKTAADYKRRAILRKLRLVKYQQDIERLSQTETFDSRVYRSELQVLFQNALLILPKRQREVLQLVFYHDLTLIEAAKVMEVSVGSARTHYERAKKRIREWMIKEKAFNDSEFEQRYGRKENQEIIQRDAAAR
ncbi:MAG TPA: RNA polymerase sigma factor [Blastocatellia bacterium]|nr:RNA polymerase sigma factor [Blastocatellia bacterium]